MHSKQDNRLNGFWPEANVVMIVVALILNSCGCINIYLHTHTHTSNGNGISVNVVQVNNITFVCINDRAKIYGF